MTTNELKRQEIFKTFGFIILFLLSIILSPIILIASILAYIGYYGAVIAYVIIDRISNK
jgi:hypothetical protein